MPLAFIDLPSSVQGSLLNKAEKRFLAFLEERDHIEAAPSSPYSVSVNVNITFVKSKASDAVETRVTTDPSATPIRLTEDEFRTIYQWDYKTLTDRCKERYQDFKQNKQYHNIRKRLEEKPAFAMVRFLNPDNPDGGKKVFYSTSILGELDKCYTRR